VLERTAVSLTHQVADESSRTFGVGIDVGHTRLTHRRHSSGEDDIGILSTGTYEFDRDVASEFDRGTRIAHG
jgi:hypothetical protein